MSKKGSTRQQTTNPLAKLSKGPCRPTAQQLVIHGGVYDDLLIPAGVNGVYFTRVIILGKITVQGHRASGTIYRPLMPGANDYAEVTAGNDDLRVVRKPQSELLKLAQGF